MSNLSSGPPGPRKGAIIAWAAAALLLAGALAWRGASAHAANAALWRRLAEAEADLSRQEAEAALLKAELDALENDPTYVESLLRRLRQVEPGERLVEPRR